MKERTKHLLIGFAAGVTAAAVLPVLLPVLSESGRPIAKALLKRSLLALETLRSNALRAAESLEDLLAEVRAEVEVELSARAAKRGAKSSEPQPAAKAPGAGSQRFRIADARDFVSELKSRMVS